MMYMITDSTHLSVSFLKMLLSCDRVCIWICFFCHALYVASILAKRVILSIYATLWVD